MIAAPIAFRVVDFLTGYCLQNASDSRDAISVTCDGPRPSSVCVPGPRHPVTVSPLSTQWSLTTHSGVTRPLKISLISESLSFSP